MKNIIEDIKAIYRNDPAVRNIEFILYAGLHAILFHRFAHLLWKMNIPFIPRLISQISRFITGIEIHPGATIGSGFFVDHGSGLVIGETVTIGKNAVLFHNVTLGGTGKHRGKRHPTLGDDVLVGTGATILGPVTIGNNVLIGANSFVVMKDVPSNTTVAGTPAVIIKRNGINGVQALPHTEKERKYETTYAFAPEFHI